eukprot:190119-Chlamydomonas_euryale.AAC.5
MSGSTAPAASRARLTTRRPPGALAAAATAPRGALPAKGPEGGWSTWGLQVRERYVAAASPARLMMRRPAVPAAAATAPPGIYPGEAAVRLEVGLLSCSPHFQRWSGRCGANRRSAKRRSANRHSASCRSANRPAPTAAAPTAAAQPPQRQPPQRQPPQRQPPQHNRSSVNRSSANLTGERCIRSHDSNPVFFESFFSRTDNTANPTHLS